MRIVFDCGHFGERGASVATYDYAAGNEAILGNTSLVAYDTTSPFNNPDAIRRFYGRFQIVPYAGKESFSIEVEKLKVDAAYQLVSGRRNKRALPKCRNFVHVMFQNFEPHGDVYAYNSAWLSQRMTAGRYPSVPHIVDMPFPNEDLRNSLGIPKSAVVVGRYGGYDQFDIEFVKRVISEVVDIRRDIFFIFMNTEPFKHNSAAGRIKFLPGSVEPLAKANFIGACDYMIHARLMGETFGLAIAEFLFQDREVIAWRGGPDQNHVNLLGETRFLYRDSTDLKRILLELIPARFDGSRRRLMSGFSPDAVMRCFESVFINGVQNTGQLNAIDRHYLKLRKSVQGRWVKINQGRWLKRSFARDGS